VVIQRLNQDEAGQLGKLTRRMAEAGVNIEVLYSDHEHRLILVVDQTEAARAVAAAWAQEQETRRVGSTRNDAENGGSQ
jgi:aspartokinase